MKRLLLIASLLFSIVINAQQKTLVNSGGFGGFIGFNSKFTRLNKQGAALFGTQLSFSVSHALNIGVAGNVLVSDVSSNAKDAFGNNNYLEMGYGGLVLEPVIASNSVVHVTLPIMLGHGVANLDRDRFYDYIGDGEGYRTKDWHEDWFWVAETGLNAEVNVFRHMRFNTGLSYRFVDGFHVDGINQKDMEGLNLNVSLKFGWF